MDDVAARNREIALEVWGKDLGQDISADAPEYRARFDKYYTQDYWNHASEPGKDRGFQNAYFVHSAFRELFTDAKFEIEMVAAEGDLVFLHGMFSAVHTGGTLFGVQASGVPVSQPQVHILRFREFKISDHYVVRDDYAMYRQVVPIGQDAGILRFVDTDQYVLSGEKSDAGE